MSGNEATFQHLMNSSANETIFSSPKYRRSVVAGHQYALALVRNRESADMFHDYENPCNYNYADNFRLRDLNSSKKAVAAASHSLKLR